MIALKGTLSAGGMKSCIFLNLSQQTSTTLECLYPQGHLWLEVLSCKHVELSLLSLWGVGLDLEPCYLRVLKSHCAVDAQAYLGMLRVVCKYSSPLNGLRWLRELIAGMLFAACAYFISSSLQGLTFFVCRFICAHATCSLHFLFLSIQTLHFLYFPAACSYACLDHLIYSWPMETQMKMTWGLTLKKHPLGPSSSLFSCCGYLTAVCSPGTPHAWIRNILLHCEAT